MKPKVTFTVNPVVEIGVKGEPHPEGFPHLPNDGGIVKGLLHFILDEELFEGYALSSGGGGYHGLHPQEEAEKIIAWLKQQGVEETDNEN